MQATKEQLEIQDQVSMLWDRVDTLELDARELREKSYELEEHARVLRAELDRLGVPVHAPPLVWSADVDGTIWWTDGYRAIKGEWPCLYEFRERGMDAIEGLAARVREWRGVFWPRLTVASETGEHVILSNGAKLHAGWFREIMRDGYTIHGVRPDREVAIRDADGDLVAVQMPIKEG